MNNKRYIDFVPAKTKKATAAGKPASSVRSTQSVKATRPVASAKPVSAARPVAKPTSVARPVRRPANSGKGELLGVVEDIDVEERIAAAKPADKPVEKPVENSVKTEMKTSAKTYNVPKSPFINQAKIEKRPLSKNVYQKNITVPKEEPKGPVTIIAKPEKDAKVRLIVAVILTIILGAAAGTVAFLLLPK